MNCQECGAAEKDTQQGVVHFDCGSSLMPDGTFLESRFCTEQQRDQLRKQRDNLHTMLRRVLRSADIPGGIKAQANGLLARYFSPRDILREEQEKAKVWHGE